MLWKRRVGGKRIVDHLREDGSVDIEGDVSVGNLVHMAETMGLNPHTIYVSPGPNETLTIHAAEALKGS